MIHPSHSILEAFSDKELVESAAATVATHLAVCEFCSGYVRQYDSYRRGLQEILDAPLPAATANFLFSADRRGAGANIIDLVALPALRTTRETHYAADGKQAPLRDIVSLATLYSESPEIVMKLMRDQRDGSNFVQLIAESSHLTANVLVCTPDQGMEIVTNDDGRAILPSNLMTDPATIHWQIRLPEATFDLVPLIYDPNKTEYSQETVLETDRGDRVRVRLMGKTVGKQVEVELLALEGKSDFAAVKIVIIADNQSQLKDAATGQRVLFALPEKTAAVNLRVFQ